MRLNHVHADYVKQQRLNTKQPTMAEKAIDSKTGLGNTTSSI